MPTAHVVAGVRTPFGRYGGALAPVRPDDLAAHVLRGLVDRIPSVEWEAFDEVVMGCANQSGEDNRNIAGMAALLAELPTEVPGSTVNRLCGSGLDAVATAARAIRTGDADLVVAGGVESMSRAPFVLPKSGAAWSRSAEIHDTTIGWRLVNPRMESLHGTDFHAGNGRNRGQGVRGVQGRSGRVRAEIASTSGRSRGRRTPGGGNPRHSGTAAAW